MRAAEASPRRALAWAAAAGLAGGALTLTREVFIGVVPIIGAWLALARSPGAGAPRRTMLLLVFLAMFAAPVTWWSALQSARQGRTILVTDKGAAALTLGYNPRNSGAYSGGAIEQPAGLNFILERPASAAKLAGRKGLAFWGLQRDWWNVPRPTPLWLARASAGTIPLDLSLPMARGGWLLIAVSGAIAWLHRANALRRWWVLPACVAAGCATHMATLSSHRFAVPFLPVVFVIIAGPAAAAMAAAWHWTTSRRTRLGATAVLTLAGVAGQWSAGPSEFVFRAADLDATNPENVLDPESGRMGRYAPAAGGVRPAMVLADEFLPAGRFQILVTARRRGAVLDQNAAVARVTVTTLEGNAACREDIAWGMLPDHGFGKVWVPCSLARDGPTTLVVESLGVTDLHFDEVALIRARPLP